MASSHSSATPPSASLATGSSGGTSMASTPHFALLASSAEKSSSLEPPTESPPRSSDSTVRGESAPGAQRMARHGPNNRNRDSPRSAEGASPPIRSGLVPTDATPPSPPTNSRQSPASPTTPTKSGNNGDADPDTDNDWLFGAPKPRPLTTSAPSGPNVRESIHRINVAGDRPISPGNKRSDLSPSRKNLVFRTSGSYSPVYAQAGSGAIKSIESPTSGSTTYSPIWRLSQGRTGRGGARNSSRPSAGSGKADSDQPQSTTTTPSNFRSSTSSQASTTGFLADVEGGYGETTSTASMTPQSHTKARPVRVTVTSGFNAVHRSLVQSGSDDEDDDAGTLSTAEAATGDERSDTEANSIYLPAYHPPIVPVSTSTSRKTDTSVSMIGSDSSASSFSYSHHSHQQLSPLSETITGDRFQPIYSEPPPAEAPLVEKRVVAIAPYHGTHEQPRLMEHFEQRPTRLERKRQAPGDKVDRSDWMRRVLTRNPDVANLRSRVQPLNRAISFCEIYNRGKGKLSMPKEMVLQLIMQYMDHEGLRGPLKALEKESGSSFQFRNLDELQLLDSRLITLIMLAINDIETIWDVAMGEKASSRLNPGHSEHLSSSGSKATSSPTSPPTASTTAVPSTPTPNNTTTAANTTTAPAPSPSPSPTPSPLRNSAVNNLTTSSEYDETNIGLSQDSEVAAKQMEMLTELLKSLRLRREDQFLGYSELTDSLVNDVNIWTHSPTDQLLVETDTGLVAAGSLNRLVELLAPEEELDHTYMRAFLVTYQLFTTSTELLAKLSQRYNVPRDPTVPDDEWRRRVLPIQIRVVNVIKSWIEEFHSDFDDTTVSNLRDFLNFQVREPHPTLAASTLYLLEKLCSKDEDFGYAFEPPYVTMSSPQQGLVGPKRVVQFSFSVDPPRPIVPKNIFSPHLKWDDVDEEELARQLTLIDFEYFYKIRTAELLHQSWSKPKLKHRAPHLLSMIRRFNVLSDWVATQIVLASKLRQRVSVLTKLIGVADHLRKLQNYNSLMAFVAVFNSSSIHRLRHTFSELPPKTADILVELKRLMRPDDTYHQYRLELEACMPPCVPYIGLYLTELTHAEDGQPTFIDGLINFSKCRLIHSIIAHMNAYQQKGYNIQAVYQIQQFLRDPQPRLGDKALQSHSSLIEPRGADKSQLA